MFLTFCLLFQTEIVDSFYQNKERIALHISLVVGLVLVATTINWITITYAQIITRSWEKPIGLKQIDDIESIQLNVNEKLESQIKELERIKEQLKLVRNKTVSHLNIMKFFYTRYYAAIVLISIAGAGAAASLISITQNGWKQSGEFTITIFWVTTAIAVFYKAVPSYFKQSQNITENKILFLKFWSLENEIRSFAATGETTYKLKDLDKNLTDAFIAYVDQKLAQDNIAIGFDDKVETDYQKALNLPKPTDKI